MGRPARTALLRLLPGEQPIGPFSRYPGAEVKQTWGYRETGTYQ